MTGMEEQLGVLIGYWNEKDAEVKIQIFYQETA